MTQTSEGGTLRRLVTWQPGRHLNHLSAPAKMDSFTTKAETWKRSNLKHRSAEVIIPVRQKRCDFVVAGSNNSKAAHLAPSAGGSPVLLRFQVRPNSASINISRQISALISVSSCSQPHKRQTETAAETSHQKLQSHAKKPATALRLKAAFRTFLNTLTSGHRDGKAGPDVRDRERTGVFSFY